MEKLTGYSDKICGSPGEAISFKVSSAQRLSYQAELVRLRCADSSATGPGFKEFSLPAAFTGEHTGRRQRIGIGSFVKADNITAFDLKRVTLLSLIWPTLPEGKEQALMGTWDPKAKSGYGLFITKHGTLSFSVGNGSEPVFTVNLETPLQPRHWYLVAATYNDETGEAIIHQIPQFQYAYSSDSITKSQIKKLSIRNNGCFRIASWEIDGIPKSCFNGKIERPRVSKQALRLSEIESLVNSETSSSLNADVVAAWDFGANNSSDILMDIGHHRLEARTYNLPTRAVRGSRWDGSQHSFTQAPSHYGAIHFHEDDLYDCGWDTDFQFEIPDGFPSGLYAAKLTMGEEEEYLPFYVRPPKGTARSRLALLIPTASYCAYANYHVGTEWVFSEQILNAFTVLDAEAQYLQHHADLGISSYDSHVDGSGCSYSSRLRPVLNMRPHTWAWQFAADTHIIDWLEQKDFDVDIFTDEDLHNEGLSLLEPYSCVMTGTHPEYYSRNMMNTLLAYQQRGGRFMYMGGNGFYWKIDYHKDFPGVIEVRRAEDGSRSWISEPGEYYHSFSGELGGLWSRNGLPPQAIAGIGFTAQGFDKSTFYERTDDSFDPRVEFVFKGIKAEEKIGNFGEMGGGAAGFEIDRADLQLGTPPHALVIASATNFSDGYHWVAEEHTHAHKAITGTTCPHVRADMVFYETPGGGAVFSTGSIAWSGALSSKNYNNNVSRITENVLRRFLDPTVF